MIVITKTYLDQIYRSQQTYIQMYPMYEFLTKSQMFYNVIYLWIIIPFNSKVGLTWWLVLRLSICFLNKQVQKSLQMNFITSSSSLKRGVSLVNLHYQGHSHTVDIVMHPVQQFKMYRYSIVQTRLIIYKYYSIPRWLHRTYRAD